MLRIPKTRARAQAAALPHVRPRRVVLATAAALLALATLALAGCADDPLPTPPDAAHAGRPNAIILTFPDTISWISKPAMRYPRKGLVAASVNGIVYAIGGAKDSVVAIGEGYEETIEVPQRTVEAFYPNSLFYAPWRLKAPLPGRRAYPNGATVINGKIYVSGGKYRKNGVDSIAKSLFVYTPSTNIWEPRADMPAPSYGGVQGVIDGKLYVVTTDALGGEDPTHLYRYDPATDKWLELAPPPHPHLFGVGGAIDGKLYVAGGYPVQYSVSPAGLAALDVYDPSQNMWATKAPLPRGRYGAAARVAGGRLYVVGGRDGSTLLSRMDAYNPVTNSWRPRTPLPAARSNAAAAVAGGLLYVIGGRDANRVVVGANHSYDVP